MACSVLIVDDSKIARKITIQNLRQICGQKDVRFFEASDGSEALKRCRTEQYDLVFLDLTMPGKSGYEVLEAFQKEGIIQKVVVLSADIQPGAQQKTDELGAAGFLKKPFDLQTTSDLLNRIGVL